MEKYYLFQEPTAPGIAGYGIYIICSYFSTLKMYYSEDRENKYESCEPHCQAAMAQLIFHVARCLSEGDTVEERAWQNTENVLGKYQFQKESTDTRVYSIAKYKK